MATIVAFAAEWPKRLLFKPTKAWRTARGNLQKIGLLAPLLFLLGGALGTPTYLAAGLVDTPLLAAVLALATGVLSAPLRDLSLGLVLLVPKIVKQRAGIVDTVEVPAVEPSEPAPVDAGARGCPDPADTDEIRTLDGNK